MKSHRLPLALMLLLALCAGAARAQTTAIYWLDTDEDTFVDLYRVDPATGQLTPIGSLPAGTGAIASLAAASDNLLYSVSWGGEVYQITVAPFTVTSLGNVGPNRISGMAYSNGGLYATDEAESALYRIELSPLSRQLLGLVTLPDESVLPMIGGDIAQSGSGQWYMWNNYEQSLFLLDVGIARATPVPAQQLYVGYTTGLAFDYLGGGHLYGSSFDVNSLLTHSLASGVILSAVPFCLNCPEVFDASFGDMASAPPAPCDSDLDGLCPPADNCPTIFNPGQEDADGDGVGDPCDSCPAVANPSQQNSDGDALGDACDNCPFVANLNQEDTDSDGVGTVCDNCAATPNPLQEDADGEGLGNACDNCPLVANLGQEDTDTDGVGTACDNCAATPNPLQEDADGEGLGNACDNCPLVANLGQLDTDAEGLGDACDN
ncbi:MAG: thrombospondin type 3 repeat-containing protein, partial [Candidatus Rokuibacteriota bacterium]